MGVRGYSLDAEPSDSSSAVACPGERLAEEIFPIFQSQDVHREAVAALMLFREAARQEQLTVRSVREYAKYLQEARTDPSLRFGKAQTC